MKNFTDYKKVIKCFQGYSQLGTRRDVAKMADLKQETKRHWVMSYTEPRPWKNKKKLYKVVC